MDREARKREQQEVVRRQFEAEPRNPALKPERWRAPTYIIENGVIAISRKLRS